MEVHEKCSWTSWPVPVVSGARPFRIAIARMLGNAVKIRDCPATVSAPVRRLWRPAVGTSQETFTPLQFWGAIVPLNHWKPGPLPGGFWEGG